MMMCLFAALSVEIIPRLESSIVNASEISSGMEVDDWMGAVSIPYPFFLLLTLLLSARESWIVTLTGFVRVMGATDMVSGGVY